MKGLRIGLGYDLHPLVPNRPLRIGGVEIPHTMGASGHSDADVLLHALCDALLGAVAAGDIGQHFPDTDPKYKNIDSRKLLQSTWQKIKDKGYQLLNMDSVVCLEQPQIAHYIKQIQSEIAQLLDADPHQLSIKATRGEGIGVIGKKEGISAQVIVMLRSSES